MTQAEAQQLGLDAGDLSMHRAGRKEWNYADKAVAEATFKRLWSAPAPVVEELGPDLLTTLEVAEVVFDNSTDDSSTQTPNPTPDPPQDFSGFSGGDSGGGGASGDF